MDNNPSSTEITWGKAKASSNKEKKFYTSFFWDNEEFFLYDNVIVYDDKVPDGHVAKIMKLWEDISSGTMMALLRWFLKPLELPSHLHSQVSIENSKELFLAFGKGKGVSNENRLDCIERKCKVLCTSTDSRNKPPSKDELEAADYFYNRIYNVDLRKLSNLGGIVKILGEHVLFNKPEWISTGQPLKCKQNPGSGSTMSQQPVEGDILSLSDSTTKGLRGMQGQSVCLKRSFKDDNFSVKRANIAESDDKLTESQPMLQATLSKDTVHLSSGPSGIVQDALERSSPSGQPLTRSASTKENEQEFSKASEAYIMNENSLGQPGPALATLALSKQIHRQDSIQHPKIQSSDLIESLSNGRVLLIQNVDPSITLKDMNDLMKSTLDGCSDVRMLQQTGSLFTQAGEALLVFETEDLANKAFQQFEDSCLIISGCISPLIASKIGPPGPGNIARFPGHFPLDNFKSWSQRQEDVMKKYFNIFHFSDPKTVEFEMATEWRNLHKFLATCWEILCKEQARDRDLCMSTLKKRTLRSANTRS